MVHLQRKFSRHLKRIETLMQRNADFEDLCNDYEEMCTWVASQEKRDDHTDQEVQYSRELIRDLEDDIMKVLKQEVE